jgi:hypothetical protein
MSMRTILRVLTTRTSTFLRPWKKKEVDLSEVETGLSLVVPSGGT